MGGPRGRADAAVEGVILRALGARGMTTVWSVTRARGWAAATKPWERRKTPLEQGQCDVFSYKLDGDS
jgi:hypothetical protein